VPYLFLCPEFTSGGLQRQFRGQECPPPSRGVSSPKHIAGHGCATSTVIHGATENAGLV